MNNKIIGLKCRLPRLVLLLFALTSSLFLTAFAEFVAPIFLIIGFKTRLLSVFPIITMFVAYVISHDGDPFSKKEKSFIYLIAFITIFFTGPGKYSIDKK